MVHVGFDTPRLRLENPSRSNKSDSKDDSLRLSQPIGWYGWYDQRKQPRSRRPAAGTPRRAASARPGAPDRARPEEYGVQALRLRALREIQLGASRTGHDELPYRVPENPFLRDPLPALIWPSAPPGWRSWAQRPRLATVCTYCLICTAEPSDTTLLSHLADPSASK